MALRHPLLQSAAAPYLLGIGGLQHRRDFDQHADHGRERRPGIEIERLIAAATASSKNPLTPISARERRRSAPHGLRD